MIPGWATVLGLGLWMPGFPNASAWREGQLTAEVVVPPQRLPVRLRRRASLLTRMVAEVGTQAAEQAGVSLQGLPLVMGSAYGELVTTMEMLNELQADQPLSPFRFHNSVHNTATGYLSMATDSQAPATALAAGNDTVAMVLQESLALLADRGGAVLALVADESLPLELAATSTAPLSAALVLHAIGDASAEALTPSSTPLAWLGDLRQEEDEHPSAERPVEESNPCATFLRLIAAVQDARWAGAGPRAGTSPPRVQLTAGLVPRWSVCVSSSRET